MVFMIVHFVMNFLGSPGLQYTGAILSVTAFLAVIFLRWDQAFYIVILYTLVGGQIKVVWGYHPFFRLCGDFLIVVLVFRSFVRTGKLFDFGKVPNFYIWMLTGHILWFTVELFNPLGAGFIPSLATGKFYIMPIFYLFALLNFRFDITSRLFKDFLKMYMFFVVLEAILVMYQSSQGPELMFGISKHYQSLFEKYSLFASTVSFRPWGTSHLPGGYSISFFLSTGFIFLWTIQPGGDDVQKLSTSKKVFIFIFTLLTLFAVFISQVRSAFIKEVMIIAGGLFFSLLGTRFVAKRIFGISFGIILFLGMATYGLNKSVAFSDYLTMDRIFARYESIGSIEKASNQRASFSMGLAAIGHRLARPIGLGLGMTTKYMPEYDQKRKQNVDIHINEYWHYDNFFAHVATEMGAGSLFLIIIVVTTPFILASLMMSALRKKNYVVYRTLCYCFVSVIAITFGQWGAVGLIYPPEFTYYFFYVALGMGSYYQAYPKTKDALPVT